VCSRSIGFTYTVNDGFGNVSTTTLTITVVGQKVSTLDSLVANADIRTVLSSTVTTAGNVVFGGAVGEAADTDSQFHTITVQGVTGGVTGHGTEHRREPPDRRQLLATCCCRPTAATRTR
jgi:hypothetical protein